MFDGDQLGYVYVSPNPLNLLKQVVVIGMNQWLAANKWQFYLPRFGVCDYFVFDLRGGNPRLCNAGYFDDSRQHADEVVPTSAAITLTMTCPWPETLSTDELSPFSCPVDDFVAAKASAFQTLLLISMGTPQQVCNQSFVTNKIS